MTIGLERSVAQTGDSFTGDRVLSQASAIALGYAEARVDPAIIGQTGARRLRIPSVIYDVVIAGAGPVGLFLACELRLAGLSVLVLEQAEDPRSPDYVASDLKDRLGLSAVLVRPTRFIAWIGEATPDLGEAERVVSRWFGDPKAR